MLKMSMLSSLVLAMTASIAQSQTSAPAPISPDQSVVTSATAPSVQSMLTKMSQQPARLNYRGSFTYTFQNQANPDLQSFHVEHWVENGVEHDRFVYLNGPEHVIVRDGQPIDCKAMGDKLLQGNFSQIGKTLAGLNDVYQFEIRKQERVAGRTARVLQVIPKDPFRYGYFLSIDEEAGVVLKSWLIDENARPLERYQFISIDFVADASSFRAKPSSHQHKAVADITPCNPVEQGRPSAWQVAWVPQGFAFAGERKLANGQMMMMYTDGLTTFSIFIEPALGLAPEGVGQRGATLAYMSRLTHKDAVYRVNVVGEIPAAAAAKIAQNISGL